MSAIATFPTQPGARVAGTYTVVAVRPGRLAVDGRPSIRLQIADASGACVCGGYPSELGIKPDRIRVGMRVSIFGRIAKTPRQHGYIRLTHCTPVEMADRASWHLWPRIWLPSAADHVFEQLIALLDRLEPAPLRGFMDQVFADESVAVRFLTAPAQDNPDAGPGSLLSESVATAEKAEQIVPFILLSETEAGLAIVGALLRRIGQTQRPGPNAFDPTHPLMAEALNLQAVWKHLAAFKSLGYQDEVSTLCEILAPELMAEQCGRRSHAMVTAFVHSLDQLSTGAALESQCSIQTSQGDLLARVWLPPSRFPES